MPLHGELSSDKIEKNLSRVALMVAQDNAINKLRKTLGDLEEELRKAGSLPMAFYQRDRDYKLKEQFLKMADHAKHTLDETKE